MTETALEIVQGKTFNPVIRYGAKPFIYKPISAISQAAPARVTAALHTVPDGWPVAIVSVQGMREINSEIDEATAQPKSVGFRKATLVDANTVDFNDINASEFGAYTSGGYLQFYTPVDLAGYIARMKIKDQIGGTELVSLTTVNGKLVIDNTLKTISILLSATETAALDWETGVYDLEIESAGGVVTAIMEGPITVKQEVTT